MCSAQSSHRVLLKAKIIQVSRDTAEKRLIPPDPDMAASRKTQKPSADDDICNVTRSGIRAEEIVLHANGERRRRDAVDRHRRGRPRQRRIIEYPVRAGADRQDAA